jgi:hypothetical protein
MPSPGEIRASWSGKSCLPAVRLEWEAGDARVRELFFCPDDDAPHLVRQVTVINGRRSPRDVRLLLGREDRLIERRLSLGPSASASASLNYELSGPGPSLKTEWSGGEVMPEAAAVRRRAGLAAADFGHPLLDHFFRCASFQLPAVVSRSGRMDGSIWQYNREWVRDQAMVAQALAALGERSASRTIFRRLLRDFVTKEGDTVDSSERRAADDVELDQNGILLLGLEAYACWTGDRDIVEENWKAVSSAADFPLGDAFRHRASGLLLNRREFWERHAAHGIAPGMELAHQLFVSLGLSSAARMARLLSREGEAGRWEREAVRLKKAVLEDDRYRLLDGGRFIKRRGPDGAVQDSVIPEETAGLPDESPLAKPGGHLLNPDTGSALPIALEFIPGRSAPAAATLEDLEALWNQAWSGGGYGRYHITSEPDSPGPWAFPSLFVARACAESGDVERVWRVLRWLESLPSGKTSGSWFEFYGERLSPPFPQAGIVPWTWAEMIFLLVRHLLGVRPELDRLRLKPRLLPGLGRLRARLPLRDGFLSMEISPGGGGAIADVRSSARILGRNDEEVSMAYPASGDLHVRVEFR